MNFETLKQKTRRFMPVFALESFIEHKTRLYFKKILGALSILLLILSSNIFFTSASELTALFFLSVFFFLIIVALDAFFYSYAFEDNTKEKNLFELADIISKTKSKDITGGFLRSNIGKYILLRVGLDVKAIKDFASKRKVFLNAENFIFDTSGDIFSSYLKALVRGDKEFEHLLITHGISEKTLISSALWTIREERKRMSIERWWSREKLETLPRLGRDWSYGKAYTLMRMSTPLVFSPYQENELHASEIEKLERALSRSVESNALLVGDEGVGKMEVVEGLVRRIMRRLSPKELHDKHFFVLDQEHLVTESTDAPTLERLLLSLFGEATRAGNVVVIIPDIANFIHIGETVGVDVSELLVRFLQSSEVTIIAIADTDDFNRVVSKRREFMQHVEKIQVDEGDEFSIIHTLEDSILFLEKEHNVFFSYLAILESVESAKRYFVDEPLFDTAEDLLIEAIAYANERGGYMIFRDDVLRAVESRTGVPTGEISSKEKDHLLKLEELLHERVVGQKGAVQAISDSLRRARSGLTNPNRPLGSFLFIGPTGVGKTETTKALSEIFFGAEAPLIRLDMSEYGTEDSVNRLIGGFDTDTPGVLASMLREQPYGVLLLDEFEKADKKVLDLFLQILDEGMFSDASGRKISARNTIIIATSNAASTEIFDTVKSGGDILAKKTEIVEKIIEQGIFKPELLNRFDGIILFHPLESEELRKVAEKMLGRVMWRLKEKGMTLTVTPELLDFLVEKGTDQKFGARPLNRAIQDTVEKIIADRIISGEYKAGSDIKLTSQDFEFLLAT